MPDASSARGTYRGRLAPSPTGLLHLGHARTLWTAWQRTVQAGGTLLLRNEDLDPQRSKVQFAEAMIEDLHWIGIRWQEGPDIGGACGPYTQSERHDLYREAWQRLRAEGWLYPCRCSRQDLARMSAAPHEDTAHANGAQEDDEPLYPGTCRPADRSLTQAADAAGVNWRFRVPDGQAIEFMDGNLGAHCYRAGRDFGDFLVWRKDGVPAYQLAVVVDDAAMRITEVVRGADLLKSTARQMLLNRALGLPDPAWFHCELLRDEQGRRLAKRHDVLSLRKLRETGMCPAEALRMAGLGAVGA